MFLQVDTGSDQLYTYSNVVTSSQFSTVCKGLSLDGTALYYTPDGNLNCTTTSDVASISTASAMVNTTHAPGLFIENDKLHAWQLSNGVFGMSYCWGSCDGPTPFQRLVENATEEGSSSLIFGLDFRTEDPPTDKYIVPSSVGGDLSSIQLGEVDPQFANTLLWTVQGVSSPSYHQFYIDDVTFCNSHILGNFSQNWQVLVDTGAACLTLPAEIYDSFHSWFDNNSVINDIANMPAFSYQVSNSANEVTTAYLPLSDLLINATDIETESGAPIVRVRYPSSTDEVRTMRLCVLRGSNIAHRVGGQTEYYVPAPQISFGTLALQSIYFAADFNDVRVGVANKLSNTYIQGFGEASRTGCAAKTVCIGEQDYHQSTNSCQDPPCSHYFFTELDEDTKKCVFNQSNMVGGLVFIILIVCAEVVSYFVAQYSVHTAMEQGRSSTMDPLTKHLGWGFSFFVDWILIHVLQWAPPRNATATVAVGRAPVNE